MKKVFLKLSLLIVCVFLSSVLVYAQTDPPPDNPDEVPLDPGSWVLVAAGVGYGVKKWKENKQQNKADSGAENEITK